MVQIADRVIRSSEDKRIPAYVTVYNRLYDDIVSGVYPNGTILPAEHRLTSLYRVSRHTLRQALTVLAQDGFILKRQGRGTRVTYDPTRTNAPHGNLCNPMIVFARREIEAIETNYNFGPGTQIVREKLKLVSNEMVLASNNVYRSAGQAIGHAFIQIPVRHIEGLAIDLEQQEQVGNLINRSIFEMAQTAQLRVRCIECDEQERAHLGDADVPELLYLEEILFNRAGDGIARCKFYMNPEEYDVTVHLS